MSALLTKLRARRAAGDREGGFTLVELLVVVVIIGVLIAIAIPVYLNYTKGARDKSAQSDVRNAISALEQCNSDNGSYPSAVDPTRGTMTGCGQTVKLSDNTSVTYTPASSNSSYVLVGSNSLGQQTKYCYDSANGGPVQALKDPATTC